MSIHFFITPYPALEWESARSDLEIVPDDFAESFLKKWPNAKLEFTVAGGILWQVSEKEGVGFFGELQANKQIVSFEPGNWTTFFDFVIWYREYVAKQYRLFFFNSSSWDSLEITSQTMKREINEFLSSSPG